MPLAHILAPQLARKAEEIQAQLEPQSTSYLQSIGAGQGVQPAEASPYADPNQAPWVLGAITGMSGAPQAFRQGFNASMTHPRPDVTGMQSAERAPFDTTAPAAPARGRLPRTIQIDPDGPAAINESGQAVDAAGKVLGYLQQNGPVRTLERSRADVRDNDRDKFGGSVLNDDLKALQKEYKTEHADYTENGYKWPKGYFEGVDPREARETRAAVKRMVSLETDADPKTGKPLVY